MKHGVASRFEVDACLHKAAGSLSAANSMVYSGAFAIQVFHKCGRVRVKAFWLPALWPHGRSELMRVRGKWRKAGESIMGKSMKDVAAPLCCCLWTLYLVHGGPSFLSPQSRLHPACCM